MLETASNAQVLRAGCWREDDGYVISLFTADDAADIPSAFEDVYGRDYLNPLVYDAAAFATLAGSGDQISLIARDSAGAFAGHVALAFSAPNRGVVELCQGIVAPAHRRSGIFARMIDRALEFARTALGAQAVMGISLTNHTISQKVVAKRGFREVGLELDYVPQRMLVHEGVDGPAATLVQYLDFGLALTAPCYLPPSYAAWFSDLLDGAAVSGQRQISAASELDRRASLCEAMDMPRFDMTRLVMRRGGFDFWNLVAAHETEAEAAGRRSLQILINLGSAEGAAAVELLRGWGYACSGLLPCYLEDGQHVAIMYRGFVAPHFSGIRLHDQAPKDMLATVIEDWQRAERLGAELRHLDLAGTRGAAPAGESGPSRLDAVDSMETVRQLLGISGRVRLETGGMVPLGAKAADSKALRPQNKSAGENGCGPAPPGARKEGAAPN